METQFPELVFTKSRNVLLVDSTNTILSGFIQYGMTTWSLFSSLVRRLAIVSQPEWAIFAVHYANGRRSIDYQCDLTSDDEVAKGVYILLSPNGLPLDFSLIPDRHRTRHPSASNTPTGGSAYRDRTRARDGKCLITGAEPDDDYSRLQCSHIFPRGHDQEWISKGFQSMITDTAPIRDMGGPLKIDSIQNIILLRSDIHNLWDNYNVAVDPDNDYTVYPFARNQPDLVGKHLQLDHIQHTDEHPIADFFRDHFWQCVLKHMKGAGEKDEDRWDHEGALGDALDLSRSDIWGTKTGKAHFEFEVANRLQHLVAQQQ